MKTKLLFASTLFFVYFGYICAQGFSENVDLKRLRLELKDVDSLMKKGIMVEETMKGYLILRVIVIKLCMIGISILSQ